MKRRVPQAERAKDAATANISRKLAILSSWAETAIPYLCDHLGRTVLDERQTRVLDFFPRSLRQFKEWDGSQNCLFVRSTLPKFGTTGNDTLAKRPELEENAIRLIVALKDRATSQLLEGRHTELKKLRTENRTLKGLLAIRRAEFRSQRLELLESARTAKDALDRLARETREFQRVFDEKELEIAKLAQEVARLTSLISSVRPLRDARSYE